MQNTLHFTATSYYQYRELFLHLIRSVTLNTTVSTNNEKIPKPFNINMWNNKYYVSIGIIVFHLFSIPLDVITLLSLSLRSNLGFVTTIAN